MRTKIIFTILISIFLSEVASAQLFKRMRARRSTGYSQHCGDPNCAMCNNNFGHLYTRPAQATQVFRQTPRRTVSRSSYYGPVGTQFQSTTSFGCIGTSLFYGQSTGSFQGQSTGSLYGYGTSPPPQYSPTGASLHKLEYVQEPYTVTICLGNGQCIQETRYRWAPRARSAPTPAPEDESSTKSNIANYVDLFTNTELVPTPQSAVEKLISIAKLEPDDVLVDIGCGDGRILKEASKYCMTLGVELNPDSAKLARENSPKSIILQGDARDFTYKDITVATMYLYPALMQEVVPLLPKGTLIVSYIHDIPNVQAEKVGDFYVGRL